MSVCLYVCDSKKVKEGNEVQCEDTREIKFKMLKDVQNLNNLIISISVLLFIEYLCNNNIKAYNFTQRDVQYRF